MKSQTVKQIISLQKLFLFQIFKQKNIMYKDSYNQRLKEIRQKYGTNAKDAGSIRPNHLPSAHSDHKYQTFNQNKYAQSKKHIDDSISRKISENIDPISYPYSTKFHQINSKQNYPTKEYESFLYSKNKDDRLKEIEKIRQNFAQSRNKAVDDYTKKIERSRSKFLQTEQSSILKQKANNNSISNPSDYKMATKQISVRQTSYRGRPQASYSTQKQETDFQLNRQLRKNYDGHYKYENPSKQLYSFDRIDTESKVIGTFKNNFSNKIDKQRELSFGINDFKLLDQLRNKNIESETPSPIRSLMKFDSLQKPKMSEFTDKKFPISKISSNQYNLGNIDKIQERIHKILAKK